MILEAGSEGHPKISVLLNPCLKCVSSQKYPYFAENSASYWNDSYFVLGIHSAIVGSRNGYFPWMSYCQGLVCGLYQAQLFSEILLHIRCYPCFSRVTNVYAQISKAIFYCLYVLHCKSSLKFTDSCIILNVSNSLKFCEHVLYILVSISGFYPCT